MCRVENTVRKMHADWHGRPSATDAAAYRSASRSQVSGARDGDTPKESVDMVRLEIGPSISSPRPELKPHLALDISFDH